MSNTWSFEWITDWDQIWSADFTQKWRTWHEHSWSAHVFFHPALVQAWVETYLPLQDIRPLFVLARQGDLQVFLPLVLWKRNWKNGFLREIIPAGYSDFDYHNPLIIGPRELFEPESFWSSLLEALDGFDIGFDSLQINGIGRACGATSPHWSDDELCPFCDISGFATPEQFLPSLKKSLRGDLRRQLRRLREQGELSLHVYGREELAESLQSLPRFLDFHSQRWPKAYKPPHLYENLLRRGLAEGLIHFSELRLDAQPISYHLGFIDKERFYYYLPAIDPAFSNLSPGKVHLLQCVEEAIAQGVPVFDHLRGEESYKSGWTNKAAQLYTLTLRKKNIASRVKWFMIHQLKPLLAG